MKNKDEGLKAYFFTDKTVREDKSLPDISKLVFSDIAYFCFLGNEKCIASNDFFSKKYGKSNGTISKAVSALEKRGYIERYLDQYKNRTIYVRRSKFAKEQTVTIQYPKGDKPTQPVDQNNSPEPEKSNSFSDKNKKYKGFDYGNYPQLEKLWYNE